MIPDDQLKFTAESWGTPGGQHCGSQPLGVWAEHLPTGLRAFCNYERSQLKNKRVAASMIEWGLAEMGIDPHPCPRCGGSGQETINGRTIACVVCR